MSAPILVVAAALVRDGRLLAARRIDPAGKWELPGGKCEPDEEPLAALQRELLEELGIRARIHDEVVSADGVWPINDRLAMRVWYATPCGEPRPRGDHDAVVWLYPTEVDRLDWLAADVPIVARIARALGQPSEGRIRIMARTRIYGLATGRVQGVNFRSSMQQQAERLGVCGWVRNRPDGRVEFEAEGSETAVSSLVGWAHTGPAAARVDGLDTHPIAPESEESSSMEFFRIT